MLVTLLGLRCLRVRARVRVLVWSARFLPERVLELNVADSFLFVGLSCSQGRERDTERGVGASIEPDYLLSARARSRRSIARALGSAALR